MRGGLHIILQLYHGIYVLNFNSYVEGIKLKKQINKSKSIG